MHCPNPRCQAPFLDFDGCMALTCHSCSTDFCGFCFKTKVAAEAAEQAREELRQAELAAAKELEKEAQEELEQVQMQQIIAEAAPAVYIQAPAPVVEVREVVREVVVPQIQTIEKIVQTPQVMVQEQVREVFVTVAQEVVRQVPVPQIQTVEKIIEVPQIQTVEKVVPVPQISIRTREVPEIIMQEVVRQVPVPQVQTVERIVEIPQVSFEDAMANKQLTEKNTLASKAKRSVAQIEEALDLLSLRKFRSNSLDEPFGTCPAQATVVDIWLDMNFSWVGHLDSWIVGRDIWPEKGISLF